MADFLAGLNPVQRQAVTQTEGPVMVIAGAGSGKTRVLTYRAAYILSEKKALPYQLLLLTFTNKAANEMKARLASILGGAVANGIWMGTFHSVFARILRMDADKLGYDRNFTIYDTEDQEKMIRSIMADLQINSQQFPVSGIRSRISSAKNTLIDPDQYESMAVYPPELKTAAIYRVYQSQLKKSNAMDFDDLLTKPIELFQQHPDALARYQNQFQYIMIDEYQDTNKAQYLIAKYLSGKNRNICVVGDDAQSIYSWRGADIQNILDFEKDFKDAAIIRLEQNYRSTKRILSLADSVIKANKGQIEKNLWTDNGDGDFIIYIEADNERDESHRISSYIQHLKLQKGYENHDFAILYRTNAQSRALEDGLRRIAVPYTIVGGLQFYKRKEVKDVLAYLRILINPRDSESFKRIVNYPARSVGDVALSKLQDYANDHGIHLSQTIDHVEFIQGLQVKQRQALSQLGLAVQSARSGLATSPLGLLIRTYIEETGIMQDLSNLPGSEARNRIENVQELINAIEEFANTREESSLEAFLQEVSLVSDIDEIEDQNAVTLMTLHAAKGLEFPVVFLSGLEDGLFPLSSTFDQPDQLEEERRLCYVGITRAKERLFLSHAKQRFRFGSLEYTLRSRFIEEMDTDSIRTEGNIKLNEIEKNAASNLQTTDYSGVNPHYWRDEKYITRKQKRSETGERQIVYDHGMADIHPGVYVQHSKFGRGRVQSVSGAGDNRKAIVDFIQFGVKTLVLKFAKLQVLK